jgi:hypothetical protein
MKNMSEFNLTEEVYGTIECVIGPRFLDQPECQRLLKQCEKLLSLTGTDALTALDRTCVELVAEGVELATDDETEIVDDLYEQREREAALRGETWEVLP